MWCDPTCSPTFAVHSIRLYRDRILNLESDADIFIVSEGTNFLIEDERRWNPYAGYSSPTPIIKEGFFWETYDAADPFDGVCNKQSAYHHKGRMIVRLSQTEEYCVSQLIVMMYSDPN